MGRFDGSGAPSGILPGVRRMSCLRRGVPCMSVRLTSVRAVVCAVLLGLVAGACGSPAPSQLAIASPPAASVPSVPPSESVPPASPSPSIEPTPTPAPTPILVPRR